MFIKEANDYKKLLIELEKCRPQSHCIVSELKADIISGRAKNMYKYYVDSWPAFNCVLGLPFTYTDADMNYTVDYYFTFYAKNAQTLLISLNRCSKIPWNRNFAFLISQAEYFDVIKRIIKEKSGAAVTMAMCGRLSVFSAVTNNHSSHLNNNSHKIPSFSKPIFLNRDSIALSESQQIVRDWELGDSRENPQQFIEWVIRNGQCIGFRDRNAVLVAYMLGNPMGEMTMLYVTPKYRRKGIGKYIAAELAKIRLEEGYDAFSYVAVEDEVSKVLLSKCGFREILKGCVLLVNYSADDYESSVPV